MATRTTAIFTMATLTVALEWAQVWSSSHHAGAVALFLRRILEHVLAPHAREEVRRTGGQTGGQTGDQMDQGALAEPTGRDPFLPTDAVAHATWVIDFPKEAKSVAETGSVASDAADATEGGDTAHALRQFYGGARLGASSDATRSKTTPAGDGVGCAGVTWRREGSHFLTNSVLSSFASGAPASSAAWSSISAFVYMGAGCATAEGGSAMPT